MPMIQTFPTGSGSGGTSKISQKSGNSLVNITGSTNPNEDGLYSEDLSYRFDRINYAQKIVNKPGREELISASVSLPKFTKPTTGGTSKMTNLGVTITLNNDINNYEYIDISLQPSSTSRKRIPQISRIRVDNIVYNNTTSENAVDGSTILIYYDIDTTSGYGGQYHANIKAWFKDSTHLYLFQGSTSIADENWRDWVITNITGVATESTIVDPVAYLTKDGNLEETPIGSIINYMGSEAPAHYLLCDGSIHNISDYPALAKHFKDDLGRVNYFGGDGVTTFAVPGKTMTASVLKLNPTMTSNTTPEGEVIYNNLYLNFRPYKAFGDSNNPAEKDCYVGKGKPSYLGYKFVNPTVISAYSLQPRGYLDQNTISGAPSAWELQASNDLTNWVTLDTQSGITWSSTSDIQSFYFNNNTAYQAYRIYATNSPNSESFIIIGNLKLGIPEVKEASYIKYETTYKAFFGDQTTYKVSVPITYNFPQTPQMVWAEFDTANAEDDISMLGTSKAAVQGDAFVAPMDGYYHATFMFSEQADIPGNNVDYHATYVYKNGDVIGGSDREDRASCIRVPLNESFTLKLKKGDTINVGVYMSGQTAAFTRNGQATFCLVNTLNENKVLELMNKPNLWVVGQEYDFGDGLYGQRFTGSVTHTAKHTAQDVVLTSTIPDLLISSGGKWNRGTTNWTLSIGQISPVSTSTSGDIDLSSAVVIDPKRGLLVRFYNNNSQTSTYDIWVKYTK